jgi:septum formation protein
MIIPEIILASASPRRAALLTQIGLPFRLVPSTLDENGACLRRSVRGRQAWPESPSEDYEARASHLALAKAQEVAARVGRGLVIGADTIVVCEGIAFGKPRDAEEAQAILLRLAGRTHQVITGVAVVQAETGRAEVASAVTAVRMRPFDPTEVAAYVTTGEPLDKAGAYAIQGRGALLVEGIEGDYSNVVGLPLVTLAELLGRFGVGIWATPRE